MATELKVAEKHSFLEAGASVGALESPVTPHSL